jgi:trehalose 6-phosphate phosphatase
MIDHALREALAAAAAADVLIVASDFDGTLSHLVDDPSDATPVPRAMRALGALADMPSVHVAVVSGRSRDVLEGLTDAPANVSLIGNHGAGHESDGTGGPDGALDELISSMRTVHETHAGTRFEVKPHGVALHYRNADDKDRAATAARGVGAAFGGRMIEGKDVIEVVLATGDKGTAIAALRDRTGGDRIVFAGDDTTDEDVFAILGDRDVGIKVGDGGTLARFRVPDPDAVAELLDTLAELRATR